MAYPREVKGGFFTLMLRITAKKACVSACENNSVVGESPSNLT